VLTGSTRATALAVALALVLVACTGADGTAPPESDRAVADPVEASDPGGPRAGGTLRIGLSSDPATLDPRFLSDEPGELIVDALFDPLLRTDAAGRVTPAAAERWEVADDGAEFTFYLREASFHDGSPVTADDFVRSFNRIADGTADPASFLAYLLAPVEGATEAQTDGTPLSGLEALDPSTLRIRLSDPDPGFLVALSDPSLVPVPEIADDDLVAFADQPVGNGPFAMTGPREPGAFVRLSRFADHLRPPLLDEVVLTVYGEAGGQDRQWSDLVDGQLHVADLDPQRRDEALEQYGTSPDGYAGPGVLDGITSTVYLYGFDTTVAPFDDVRIRRALSLAVDREALAEDVMRGTRAPATSIVPPSLPGSQDDACTDCRYDPEAAAELLAEVRAGAAADADGSAEAGEASPGAEADDGRPAPVLDRLTLTHTRGDTHAAIAERMAADIASALDVEVDFQARDLQAFIQSVRAGEVPVFRLGWEVTVPDPGAYLRPLFDSSQVGLDNLSRYAEPEVDALLETARQAPGDRQRLAGYREAEERILEDMPVLPLLWYRHSTVVAPEVQELVYSPFGHMNLDEVWLDPDAE
jgi:oligopeptide transport system substrate-binding protein